MKMDEIMTSGEVVEVFALNNLPALMLPDNGIADRYHMGEYRIGTERYFRAEEVARVGYLIFKDDDWSELVMFFDRFLRKLAAIKEVRRGNRNDWLTAHEAADMMDVSREWLYQLSDFRGGKKTRSGKKISIKTIEFGRIRLFWKRKVAQLAREKKKANAQSLEIQQ